MTRRRTCIISLLYEKDLLYPCTSIKTQKIRINLLIDLGQGSAALFPLIGPLAHFSTGSSNSMKQIRNTSISATLYGITITRQTHHSISPLRMIHLINPPCSCIPFSLPASNIRHDTDLLLANSSTSTVACPPPQSTHQLPHLKNPLLSIGYQISRENSIRGGPADHSSGNSIANDRTADA